MKLKLLVMSLFLCMTLMVSGCGGSSDSEPAGGEPAAPAAAGDKAEQQSSSDFKQISDFADAWNAAYEQNEAAINSYEVPIMELVTPGTEFITGVQYDLLNMENKDGRFEGELMMAGFPGFVEKDGSKITFGYDYTRDEDGFSPSMKAGNRLIENGSCDLAAEIYQTESYTERNGEKVQRSYSEFKRLKNQDMICLVTNGSSFNLREEADPANTCIYIKAGKDKFDFVIGKATVGPAFEKLSFVDKSDLTKDDARKLMEAAGYQIEQTGGISGGTLVVD